MLTNIPKPDSKFPYANKRKNSKSATHTLKILQQTILNLSLNLESARFLRCVWPFWNIFKRLKCQVSLMDGIYVSNDETSLWNEQKKLWNMIYSYLYLYKAMKVVLTSFESIINDISNKSNRRSIIPVQSAEAIGRITIHNWIFKSICRVLLFLSR